MAADLELRSPGRYCLHASSPKCDRRRLLNLGFQSASNIGTYLGAKIAFIKVASVKLESDLKPNATTIHSKEFKKVKL
ncbi:hypothetical protein [Nostoc sp.]